MNVLWRQLLFWLVVQNFSEFGNSMISSMPTISKTHMGVAKVFQKN